MIQRLRAVAAWFDAADPAAVRRRQGTRATLAALCTWLSMRGLATLISGHARPAPVLYGVVACFVGALVIADPKRSDRLATMALGAAANIAAIAVAAALHGQPRVRYLVLLALMYASFAVRRYGLRAGEVALIATMAMYFAGSSGVRIDELGWFVGAAHRIRRATSDA